MTDNPVIVQMRARIGLLRSWARQNELERNRCQTAADDYKRKRDAFAEEAKQTELALELLLKAADFELHNE